MQNGFCHPESRMEKAGIGVANQRAIIPNVLRLLETVRPHGIPVFWSKQVHFPEDVIRQRRRIPSHQSKQRWTPCVRGTWEVDFVQEVLPHIAPEDYVIEKHRASIFFETTARANLIAMDCVEVAPFLDPSGTTARVGARVVLDVLAGRIAARGG
jgi:ureidoacrylate peracid hydrolase